MSAPGEDPAPLFSVLYRDAAAMKCLETVRACGPFGAYIAAGFVRNRFWDQLYPGQTGFACTDIDVIYFDPEDISTDTEQAYEAALLSAMPDQQWQVRNQARMHRRAGHKPFSDAAHALTHWPEVATAIGVRMANDGTLEHIAPFGLADLYDHILRITPIVREKDPTAFEHRLQAKGWCRRWPKIKVVRD